MPLLLRITEDSFSQSQSNCYMSFYHERVRHLIFVKYDITQTELQCVCRHAKSCPAGDRFLCHTNSYTKVNMVIIELYKPRVTLMEYIEGK